LTMVCIMKRLYLAYFALFTLFLGGLAIHTCHPSYALLCFVFWSAISFWLFTRIRSVSAKRDSDTLILSRFIKNLISSKDRRIHLTLDSLSAGIMIIDDRNKTVLFANPAACKMLGVSEDELLHSQCSEFCKSEDSCPYYQNGNHGEMEAFEQQIVRADGSVVCLLKSAVRVELEEGRTSLIETMVDITQRKEAEETMIRNERLAAVGILSAGVAHEFNNINAITKGHIDIILATPGLVDAQVAEQLRIVQKAIERGANITKDLLTFTSEAKNDLRAVMLSDLVLEVMNMMKKELSLNHINVDYRMKQACAKANTSKISHVIVNLIINAKHAMINSEEKLVTIETGETEDKAFIRITDTGCGIPKEDIPHLFTPFFSTKGVYARNKEQAKVSGAGLGLAVIHTIVTKHHDGQIEVVSEVGKGTSFTIWLPKTEMSEAVFRERLLNDARFKGHGQRILIADDEEDVRHLIAMVLEQKGFDVFVTDDGQKALVEHGKRPFDLVIVDLAMPKMSGQEVIKRLNNLPNPPAKIVITGALESKELIGLPCDEKMYKPFDLFDLFEKIVSLLKQKQQ